MNRNQKIKKITGVGVMLALTIVLQIVSSHIRFGTVEIALGLIPMILGACIYGPAAGFLLGSAQGIVIMLSPATLAAFMPVNPIATILLCILKTGLAGLASGYIYRALSKKNSLLGVGISSIISPIINTGIYICGVLIFFLEVYGNSVSALIVGTLTINFLIEIVVMAILVPIFERILKIYGKKILPED